MRRLVPSSIPGETFGAAPRAMLALLVVAFGGWTGCTATAEPELPPRATVETDAGGQLMPEQAAYDVLFYDLDLAFDPGRKSISGVLVVKARILEPLSVFVLDLDRRLTVERVERLNPDGGVSLSAEQRDGRLWIELDRRLRPDEEVRISVAYAGQPRVAPNPPWEGGFTWAETEAGEPWFGVSCQIDGADLWWPCKDHPSDEPDEGVALHYRVPSSLTVAANGRLEGVDEHADGTRTWHWRVSDPINTYNVTVNAAPFRTLETDYRSVTGETIPVTYWVVPEDYEKGADLFPELLEHLRFLEETLGPYPFRADKYGVVEAPYLAMEHQTVITYGAAFGVRRFGFHWIAFHELAHEWWGNLVSASDWRDFWLHEGFDGYMEALYVEKLHGRNAYHEYLARFFHPGILNQRPVAARAPRSIRQVYYALPPDYTRVDSDSYSKGALVLHTLRYLLGDETFFRFLRRQAYPRPELESVTDGSQTRITTTEKTLRLVEEVAGRNLEWFFEVYVRQPELPRLVSRVEGGSLQLHWEAPEGLHFPMPVEVVRGGERLRVPMPGGEAVIPWSAGDEVLVDPDFWILRQAAPDPDRFGTLGLEQQTAGDEPQE